MRWIVIGAMVAMGMLAAPAPAWPGDVSGRWELHSGEVAYEVSHALHGAIGRSRSVHGQAECAERACTFRFRVPLASFRSGDADRDQDMRTVTHAAQHPDVIVEGQGTLVDAAQVQARLRITWAGRQRELPPLRLAVERGWWRLRVKGDFTVQLSAFGIERPALLGLPIADDVRIYVDLTLRPA